MVTVQMLRTREKPNNPDINIPENQNLVLSTRKSESAIDKYLLRSSFCTKCLNAV
jgi:hypothetical protein